ncbi:glycosyltransferase family 4 protein [Flavobacterium sp. N2820]|uniref:glycosyltransferase family 4 protein n=1 Tax=Flavobacterium sp. N2820 TaxID=2986834 RepID=UPI00222472FD|nr:glycosyltransferase family 4 protein [Flavobacterium sp. N2820]
MQNKLIRITTVPISLEKLLENQLRFMKSHYEVTAISSDKSYLERVGQLQEVPVFHVEMTRQITPIKDLISVLKLYRFFKKQKPFIVHTHTPKAGTVGMIAAKLAGVPNRLHTIAGLPLLETTGNKRRLLNFVEKVTYSCATKIYPNSFGLNEIIIREKFCNTEKLKVLGNGSTNGIDTSFFSAEIYSLSERTILKEKLEILPEHFVFIFVGRLVSDKGINELITAFKKFTALFANTKLLLVGPLETELDPLATQTLEEIEHNKSIISVGYQNDVRPYFAISDCLVFPSYREGFPNVVLQAGAMELPSIVTDINGCNEIIIQSENGTIIPVKNVEAIVEAMKKMYTDHDFYKQLKQNARSMIQSRYEQSVVWQALLAEYNSLITQNKKTKG